MRKTQYSKKILINELQQGQIGLDMIQQSHLKPSERLLCSKFINKLNSQSQDSYDIYSPSFTLQSSEQNLQTKKAIENQTKIHKSLKKVRLQLLPFEESISFFRKHENRPSQCQAIVLSSGMKVTWNSNNQNLHGFVQIVHPDGSCFNGQYYNGVRVEGKMVFANGFEYDGTFRGDQFKGQGSLKFPNGKIISGQWNGMSINKNAKIIYPDEQIYYGQIVNFKKHGRGILFFTDNTKYQGYFTNGEITGQGRYYQNDTLIAQGEWVDGQLVNKRQIQSFK